MNDWREKNHRTLISFDFFLWFLSYDIWWKAFNSNFVNDRSGHDSETKRNIFFRRPAHISIHLVSDLNLHFKNSSSQKLKAEPESEAK